LPNHDNQTNKSKRDLKSTVNGWPMTFTLGVPVNWTPEQARAIIDLLDRLRDLIWAHYGLQVLDEFHDYDNLRDPPF
jgi:hypothetical protein